MKKKRDAITYTSDVIGLIIFGIALYGLGENLIHDWGRMEWYEKVYLPFGILAMSFVFGLIAQYLVFFVLDYAKDNREIVIATIIALVFLAYFLPR